MGILDVFDPWRNQDRDLRSVSRNANAAPAPAQDAGSSRPRLGSFFGGDDSGGGGGGFRDFLGNAGAMMMMLDPMSANAGSQMMQLSGARAEDRRTRQRQNETAQWLMSTGVGPGEAKFLTGNQAALNAWYSAWKTGDKPDWQIHELYNAKGEKQAAMIDMKTGKMNFIGGSAAAKPNLKLETIYTEDGNEQKVLINQDDPTQPPIPIGGKKTNVKTPEELAQAIEIAKAGAAQPAAAGETQEAKTEGEYYAKTFGELQTAGRKASAIQGRIALMQAAVNAPGFQSGGAGTGQSALAAKQLLDAFGIKTEGTESMEVFNSLAKQAVYDTVGSLGTGFSEGDRLFTEQIVPNLGVSKGGNLAMLAIQQKLQDRAPVIAKMAREYKKANNGKFDAGFDDVLNEWAQDHPIFSPADIERITKLATIPDNAPGTPGVVRVEPVVPAPTVQSPAVEPPAILPPRLQPRVQPPRPVINTLPPGVQPRF